MALYALSDGDGGASGRGSDPETAAPSEPWLRAACELSPEIVERVARGAVKGRSPEIHMVPRYPNFFGSFRIATHSGPWDYLQRVPLVFYGPGFVPESGDVTLGRPVTLADLAPTLGDVLQFPLPEDRDGVAVTEALVAPEERTTPPRLVVLVVWDGAGWNVLDRWPKAWPFLRSLMTRGVSVQDVTVGSSPSVTPAIHTTMGTGTFPREHGIPDIPLRNGPNVPDSFPNKSGKFPLVDTLADLFDVANDNRPLVGIVAERGWHLGMMGRGALAPGGDRDFAVMRQGGNGTLTTNARDFRLPPYLQDVPGLEEDRAAVDAADGTVDGAWMGHPLPTVHKAGAANPVWMRYQTRLLQALINREGFGRDDTPDLLFTNLKEPDLVGHIYNLVNPEMRSTLRHADDALETLVRHLDRVVGRERWVMAVTADHGHGPSPRSFGAWPIDMDQLRLDIAVRFRVRVTEFFQAQRPTGLWLRPRVLERRNIALEDIAEFLLDYTLEDNVSGDKQIPKRYRARASELLFEAAFPTARIDEVVGCVEGAT